VGKKCKECCNSADRVLNLEQKEEAKSGEDMAAQGVLPSVSAAVTRGLAWLGLGSPSVQDAVSEQKAPLVEEKKLVSEQQPSGPQALSSTRVRDGVWTEYEGGIRVFTSNRFRRLLRMTDRLTGEARKQHNNTLVSLMCDPVERIQHCACILSFALSKLLIATPHSHHEHFPRITIK
jgi:hypothetical protein